jgi:hypothetical protein
LGVDDWRTIAAVNYPRVAPLAFAAALGFLTTACGGGGLKLVSIKQAQNRPSNIAVYFKVQTSGGEPVGGLTAEEFRIYEDGSLVSAGESKQTILNPEVAASHYTLLLVDMSGSITSDPQAVETLVAAATAFTERIEKSQKVAVYAFDGSTEIHPIVPFTSAGGAKSGVKSLGTYKAEDPSTNLNGAIVKGLADLETALSQAEHPMRFGTLVVFSDGTDRANRVSKEDMRKAVSESKFEIFAIGLGKEMQESELKDIGKDGTAKADDKASVVKAFDTIGARIEGQTKSYYLLSYCSPSRAGKHEVRIEAVHKEADGKSEKTGSVTSEFDAQGFTHGCDPNTPPHFDVTKGDALAPPPKKASDDERHDKPKPAKPKVHEGAAVQLPPPPPPAAPAAPPAKKDEFVP